MYQHTTLSVNPKGWQLTVPNLIQGDWIVNPRLNDQANSFDVLFDAHNVRWRNEISMRKNIEQSVYFRRNQSETSCNNSFDWFSLSIFTRGEKIDRKCLIKTKHGKPFNYNVKKVSWTVKCTLKYADSYYLWLFAWLRKVLMLTLPYLD